MNLNYKRVGEMSETEISNLPVLSFNAFIDEIGRDKLKRNYKVEASFCSTLSIVFFLTQAQFNILLIENQESSNKPGFRYYKGLHGHYQLVRGVRENADGLKSTFIHYDIILSDSIRQSGFLDDAQVHLINLAKLDIPNSVGVTRIQVIDRDVDFAIVSKEVSPDTIKE